MSRLNRKRKASGVRETKRERGKKICLERSVAKTLLTLHRHSGKSKSEHSAAGALFDLSLEPVVNTAQPDDSLLRRGSAEKSECRRKIPWKATAGASARNHAQYGCDPGESFCN